MVAELHVLALACYVLTAGLVGASLTDIRRRRSPDLLVLGVGSSAAAFHFAGLLTFVHAFGRLPVSGTGPGLSTLALLVGVIVLVVQGLTKESAIGLIAGPLVAALLVGALLVGFGSRTTEAPPTGWFVAHAATSLLGLAFLAVASAASALYLLQHRQLKGRRFGVMFQFLPSLEQLDHLNRFTLLMGFPVLTASVLLVVSVAEWQGTVWTVSVGKLVWAGASWVLFGLLAGARATGRVRGLRAAHTSVAVFLLVVAGYVLVRAVGASGSAFMP